MQDSADKTGFPLAAILSGFIPGLGQLIKGRWAQGLLVLLIIGLLVQVAISLGRSQDRAAEIFFFLMVVLPIWIIQMYDAYLPYPSSQFSLKSTLQRVWSRGHDIRYLGALFLLSSFLDLYIILANPSYALPFFCTKPTGPLGLLAKMQSPVFHIGIGLGFLRLQKWALLLFFAYAGLGLINAFVNYACFGFGRIRTVLVLSLLLFSLYLWWRRHRFAINQERKGSQGPL